MQTRVWWDSGVHQDRLPVLAGISCGARTHRRNVPHLLTRHYRQRLQAHRAQHIACDARSNKGPDAVVRRAISNRSGGDAREGDDGQFCDGITAGVHSSGWRGSFPVDLTGNLPNPTHPKYAEQIVPHSDLGEIDLKYTIEYQYSFSWCRPATAPHLPLQRAQRVTDLIAAAAGPAGPAQLQPPRWVLRRGLPQ